MLPKPIEHAFIIDDDRYLLVEWDRGAERRIRADYAMAIAAAPNVIDSIDGQSLYIEAVARECLKEAPPIFWEERPPGPSQNGTPKRVITLEHIPRRLWEVFCKEVNVFLALIFPPVPAESGPAPEPGASDEMAMAAPQAVSPLLRGRAE